MRHARRSSAVRVQPAAFEGVYREHHQAIYRYCRAILRHEDDAYDALQSTMTRAYAALQTEHRDFELRPWLFRIAHNESISLLRQRRPTADLEAADAVAGDSLERLVGQREELGLLRADLSDLPDRQRSALVMRELSGLPHEEIAAALEISPGAAKQAIFEARTALHQCREGRELACEDIRRTVSDADGRVLRSRRVRAHLRSCPGCRDFAAALRGRPQQLSMIAPALPATAGVAVLAHIVPGAKLVSAGAGALSTGGVGSAVAVKTAVAVAMVAGTAGGVAVVEHREPQRAPAAPAAVHAPAATGRTGAAAAASGTIRPRRQTGAIRSHGAGAPPAAGTTPAAAAAPGSTSATSTTAPATAGLAPDGAAPSQSRRPASAGKPAARRHGSTPSRRRAARAHAPVKAKGTPAKAHAPARKPAHPATPAPAANAHAAPQPDAARPAPAPKAGDKANGKGAAPAP